MSSYIVTVIDTTQVQSYIFNSNRLRENIGASHLVARATDAWVTNAWVRDALTQLGGEFYIPPKPDPEKAAEGKRIERDNLVAELVYAGGGNTVLMFASPDYAIQFTRILSKRLLEDAPGLNIVAAHKPFEWDTSNSLRQAIANIIEYDLERKKREGIPSTPLLGLSVTAACTSSGQVAVGMSHEFGAPQEEENSYPVSREIAAKLKAVEDANNELQQIFRPSRYNFPYRMDHLGRSKEEMSYVAVVHADGNNMGNRFKNHGANLDNRAYITAIRELSWSVNAAGRKALQKIHKKLEESIEDGEVKGEFSLVGNYLPFRPLVYGGDDVTFVCDGRLGLTLAALYLEEFEKQEAADKQQLLTACAGICIVKSHYPFARAYALSEALCGNAKSFMREKSKKENTFSALDWHIASSGLLGSIGEIRDREYRVLIGENLHNLTMRPVRLQPKPSEWRTWSGFGAVVDKFKTDENWKDRRNKVISLREVLRQGPTATKQWLQVNKPETLPPFPERPKLMAEQGWDGDVCGYFDAIEAMEFYLPL